MSHPTRLAPHPASHHLSLQSASHRSPRSCIFTTGNTRGHSLQTMSPPTWPRLLQSAAALCPLRSLEEPLAFVPFLINRSESISAEKKRRAALGFSKQSDLKHFIRCLFCQLYKAKSFHVLVRVRLRRFFISDSFN